MGFGVVIFVIFSQQLSSLGFGICCPTVQGHMCCITLDYGGVQEAHVPQEWPLCMSSDKPESEFPGHSSAFQAFLMNPCLVQQVPAQLH